MEQPIEIHSIDTGLFKLDGGAMFGVVPKSLWQKSLPADEQNMCDLAMRLLLIKEGQRLILIDTGIGSKQDEKFFSRYHLHGPDTLDSSLKRIGYQRSDITDVFLTHLHFDHVGGAVQKDDQGHLTLSFPNATYWSNQLHWDWALRPNAREKASFLPENLLPLQNSGHLQFLPITAASHTDKDKALIDNDINPSELGKVWTSEVLPFTEHIGYQVVGGHTRAMMVPFIRCGNKTLVYVTDLIPTIGHFPLPYIASFDVFPLMAMAEKEAFLEKAIAEEYIIFFEHDAVNQCCTVKINEKGKVVPREIFTLDKLLGQN
jgi:glyoxylase-like metal-dependent hydrolase (beta-lactamase superfamily II)